MKLIYSPFFTGECYRKLTVNKPLFEKIVGDAGLLDFLELSLGLPSGESSAIDRILAYRKALETAIDNAFYKAAFPNDPLATAKELLHWRDLLIMEGFDAETDYQSERLKKLAEVEKEFVKSGMVGTPERWRRVLASAKGKIDGVEIEVYHDLSLLPKLICDTLKAIGVTKGQNDGLGAKELGWTMEGKELFIKNFGTVAEAYSWAAENKDCDTVICPDTFRLNAVLRNKEMPLLDASAGGDSSIMQLFRLGLSLLERPVDIQNLLEYLRTGFSPIPGKTRYNLANTLKREGGRGDKWEKAISDSKDKDAVNRYLLSLLNADVSDGVDASVVTEWCAAIAEWAKDSVTEEKLAYLMALKDLCNSMIRVIEEERSDKIDVGFLQKAIKTLYEPKAVQSVKAMAGSWEVVASHRCFVDNPDSLMWLPCNGGLETPYQYSFMFQEEIDELHITKQLDCVRYDFNLMLRLLGQVKRIVLCSCDFDCSDALVEHPAVTLCKKAAKEEDMRKSIAGTTVFKPTLTFNTGIDLFPKRESESGEIKDAPLSATGIDTLIGYPFDFIMDKTLGFKDISSLQLSTLVLTQGTVAHYVFERMLKDSDRSIKQMRSLLDKETFGSRVEAAAMAKGAILLRKEHRTLLSNLKESLCHSIGVLLDILEKNNLIPKSSEDKLDNLELEGLGEISGSVDFYAETRRGEIVVFDFKYSKGSAYIEKLSKNQSVQLELYAEGLSKKYNKAVVAIGYYFFPINQLHIYDDKGIIGEDPKVIKHTRKEGDYSLSEQIRNSVDLRKSQLKKGELEMGEECPLADIDYHNSAVDGHIIDIPEGKGKVKATSPFSNPTKYPILKNVIK